MEKPLSYRWLLTILYGLLLIWTGLQRSIEAQEFKPNAFWFCLVTGILAIAAGYAMRVERKWLGTILASLALFPVLVFYLNCFITQPEKDATYRVALAILASIGELCVITIPRAKEADSSR